MKKLTTSAEFDALRALLDEQTTYVVETSRVNCDTIRARREASEERVAAHSALVADNSPETRAAWKSAVAAENAAYAEERRTGITARSAKTAAERTCYALLARLLLDNAETLRGENLRYKRTLLRINACMPEEARAIWMQSYSWGGRLDLCGNYIQSRDNGFNVVEVFNPEKYADALEWRAAHPGARPEEISAQIDALKSNAAALREAHDAMNAAFNAFKSATAAIDFGEIREGSPREYLDKCREVA